MSGRAVAIALLLLTASCSTPDDETAVTASTTSDEFATTEPDPVTTAATAAVSLKCDQAMRNAAAESDFDRADPLIDATLSACTGVDEWLAALRRYPAALGLAGPEYVGDLDLKVSCGVAGSVDRATPVCKEAEARGLI